MDIERALELSKTYGITTVLLFLTAMFLIWLVIYVLRQNEKRENRLISLTEIHINNLELDFKKQNEATTQFRMSMVEDHRQSREEHRKMIDALDKILEKVRDIDCPR